MDSKGNIQNDTCYQWDFNKKYFQLKGLDTYRYNDSGSMIENISYLWDTTFKSWINSYKCSNLYDSFQNLIDSSTYNWNTTLESWKSEYKYVYYSSQHKLNQIQDEKISEDLILYPNPSKDQLFLNFQSQYTLASVYSIEGILIQTTNIHPPQIMINVSQLPKGIYVLKVYSDKAMLVKRFIKD